jgi:hypothetical protein
MTKIDLSGFEYEDLRELWQRLEAKVFGAVRELADDLSITAFDHTAMEFASKEDCLMYLELGNEILKRDSEIAKRRSNES